MPHMLRNLILMILLFCRTLLSCLEAEISVKIDFTYLSAIISYQRLNNSEDGTNQSINHVFQDYFIAYYCQITVGRLSK